MAIRIVEFANAAAGRKAPSRLSVPVSEPLALLALTVTAMLVILSVTALIVQGWVALLGHP